jgi:hypothetical protein
MSRFTGPLVALLFSVVLCAPSLMVLQFQVHRAYIERELCVQREVMADMRTCHGECHITKRFKALEREADAGFPGERIQVRHEPVVLLDTEPLIILRTVDELSFPPMRAPLADGHAGGVEPVPRG